MVTNALTLMCRLRRLLEDVSEQSDQTCPGGGVSFFGPSSPGEITVNGTLVCGAGDNEVVYDIGTLDASGNFIASELSVFSQVIRVLPGAPSCFQIVNDYNRAELTFHAILSSLLLQIMDDGRNVRSLVWHSPLLEVACRLLPCYSSSTEALNIGFFLQIPLSTFFLMSFPLSLLTAAASKIPKCIHFS